MAESKFTTIKNKIEAEIDAANEVTGEEDTTLHDAVETLVEGYHTGVDKYQGYADIANKVSEDVISDIIPCLYHGQFFNNQKIKRVIITSNPFNFGYNPSYTFYKCANLQCFIACHSGGSTPYVMNTYYCAECTGLKLILFNTIPGWAGSTFTNTSSLKSFILTTKTLLGMGNSNVFNGSSIANGTGYVYVPDSLVDSYKTATNWVKYATQIKGFSEASAYSESVTYTMGDLCLKDSKLYAWINMTGGNSVPNLTVNNFDEYWFCVAEIEEVAS